MDFDKEARHSTEQSNDLGTRSSSENSYCCYLGRSNARLEMLN